MALSEPSIEKENNKQTTEETLNGIDEGNVQVITGPTEIEGPGSANENGSKAKTEQSTTMRVRKRNGDLEEVDVNKIVNAVARCAEGLMGVDPMRVATRTISALADGATTRELDELSIRTAAGLIVEEPRYSRLAGRLLATYIDKEVRNQNIPWFTESVIRGHELGVIGDNALAFVLDNASTLNAAINSGRDKNFEFFGLRTVYDRYLLRHPETRDVIETPQYFFLRVACGLSQNVDEAVAFYDLMSSLAYLPSSPTLFNSGTTHQQLSSCYLLDSPEDSLEGIYKRYTDIAQLSKFAGGIGVAWHRIRSKGSLIKGTNGLSNGIVPWLKTLDSSVAAVNQGGRRKGAACIYLETWHDDIEEFLELKQNTGDHARRTHNLNIANWVPDLFMKRVENNWQWSLFDPQKVPHLTDLFGEEFEKAYIEAEEAELYERQVDAQDLYLKMMRTLAETGNGWMTFKDSSNQKCNQTSDNKSENDYDGGTRVVHLSNLCTEIIEVTNQTETAVCNLGSLNLGSFVTADEVASLDYEELGRTVNNIFLAGHSQGGYIVTRLNTIHQTNGVIANAPGPLNLVYRCQLEENGQIQSSTFCTNLRNVYGTTSNNPNAYFQRSLLNFTNDFKSDILFVQGLDDSTIQMYLWPTFKQDIISCSTCQNRQFVEIPGGGHVSLFESLTAKTEFNNFLNNH